MERLISTIRRVGVVSLPAIIVLSLTVRAMPESEYRKLFREGQRLLGKHSFPEAHSKLSALLKESSLTEQQRVQCLEALGTICCWTHKFPEALKYVNEVLEKHPTAPPATVARCCKLKGWALGGSGDKQGAIDAARKAVKVAEKPGSGIKPAFVATYLAELGKALVQAGNYDESAAAYEESMKTHLSATGLAGLVKARLGQGNAVEATRGFILLCALPDAREGDLKTSGPKCLALIRRSPKLPDAGPLLATWREALPGLVSFPDRCRTVQKVLVAYLARAGDMKRALFEGRVLLRLCNDDQLPEALGLVSNLLKQIDGNVSRANALLLFAKFGKAGPDGKLGTKDDFADPLRSVSPPDAAKRDAAFKAAMGQIPAKDWTDHVSKSLLYRLWDRPREALAELRTAFRQAPMEQGPMQQIMQATMQVLVQVTGDPGTADKYSAFQRFGPAGPDRKKGTDDDLEDPVAKALGGK